MTTEALDLLSRLSSPELAEKAEAEANRPFNRFAGRRFKADIPQQDLEIISRRVGNSNFDEWGMFLTVEVTDVYEGNVNPGEHQLWVRSANPTTRDGKENKRTKNSELVQMTAAAGRGPRQWVGSKGVDFKDSIFTYTYDRNTNEPDPAKPGSTIWQRGVKGETWYYALNFSGASSNGASTPTPTPVSPELIETALSIIRATGEAGMPEKDFALAASKIKALQPLWGQIADTTSNNFVTQQMKAEKISKSAEGNLVVA